MGFLTVNEIVTYFSTHKSDYIKPVRLIDVLSDFKNGEYADIIACVRAVLAKEGEDAYKKAKRSLPAIAFCGEFVEGHAKGNLVK